MRSQREYELAVGLMNEGSAQLAVTFQHLFSAIELDPENADAHFLLGNLFLFQRDDARAEEHLRAALRIRGRDPQARNSLGVLYIHQRHYDEAIRELREATGDLLNREPHLAWGNLGWAYYEKRDYRHALEALTQAVRLQRRFCVGHYRMGQTYSAMRDYSHAEEALTHALEVQDPSCQAMQEAWLLRGQARAQLGRREDAISDFEHCVTIDAQTDPGHACQRLLEATH